VALLSRAAELSPDPDRAAERRVVAAEAALERGSSRQARVLVQQAVPAIRGLAWQARAERVSGLADVREGNLAGGAPRLRHAAVGLLPTDPMLGRRTLLEAVDIAVSRGDAAQSEFMQSIAATKVADLPVESWSVTEWLLHAFSTNAREGYAAAAPEYHKAIARCRNAAPHELAPWANLIAAATRAVWDDTSYELLLQRVADWSRSNGALLPLSTALLYLGSIAAFRGQLQWCSALNAQALDLVWAAHQYVPPVVGANFDAIAGRDADLSAKVALSLDDTHTGQGGTAFSCHNALIDLHIGRGRYAEALHSARPLFDADPMMGGEHAWPNMVEAAVRVADATAAGHALARLAKRATAAGTPWALGLMARSQALIAGADRAAEEHYARAIELLGATSMALEHGRSHLLYGEWLRRQRRPADARDHLGRAYNIFATAGAEGFAERARVELHATGGRARRHTVGPSTALTSQEAQVARLAADGHSNAEIAAQLFISANTVEYHLVKVFRKLSVTSRGHLWRALAQSDRSQASP
jgi:DNA-binding CsgD family transcriptional regulator